MIELNKGALVFWTKTNQITKIELEEQRAHKDTIAKLSDDIIADLIYDSPHQNDPVAYKLQITDEIAEIDEMLSLFETTLRTATITVVQE